MDDLLGQVLPVFAAEVLEQVVRMTTALLKSEAEPELQAQEIEAFFRQAHNLKGSAAALGIGELAALAHSMESALLGVRRKQQVPPRTIVGFYQIGMTGSLYRGTVLCVFVYVCQDWVGGITFIRAVNIPATGNGYLMPIFSTSFGNQQIIPTIFLINMWPFRMASARTVPDTFGFA